MPTGPDPIDRLRAADPIRADEVPDASLARVSARIQEHIVTDIQQPPPPRPATVASPCSVAWPLAGAFALAIAFGSSLGAPAPGAGPIAANPSPSENPAAGGGGLASCLAYDPANLPTFDIVFDGTVTAVDGDQVTFDVNEGWKGADGSITLTAPDTSTSRSSARCPTSRSAAATWSPPPARPSMRAATRSTTTPTTAAAWAAAFAG